jgi:ATP-binding cassette subfamily F protein 3
MIICNVVNVTKSHGANPVLEGVTLEIQEDARIGLVGPNGAGKSTLLRIVAGEDAPDTGSVARRRGLRVGYVPQEVDFGQPPPSVVEAAREARSYLAEIESELGRLEMEMARPEVYRDPDILARVVDEHERATARHDRLGGLNFEGRVLSELRSVGFTDEDFALPTDALSGGQKKLLYLARVLATEPELLLLDEPDNHLDIVAKENLERLIVNYPGAVVVISHDRHLLDVVVDDIAEIEMIGQHPGRPQLTVFHGTYSEYAADKRLALLRQQAAFELQRREITRLEHAARRLMSWSGGENEKFVRRARNIEKRIERMEKVERPILEPARIGLELKAERGGFKVLELAGVHKSFDQNHVLRGIDLLITHGERVALMGPNGAGKSVLFRIVLGREAPTAGEVTIGARIAPGYYSQEQETLDDERTPVDEVRGVAQVTEEQALSFLGMFLFDQAKSTRKVRFLSGGEKARLQMAKLMIQGPNLLVLDEPTNNLDIQSAEVLEDAIDGFKGTVFVISHDRYFLDRIATRYVHLDGGRLHGDQMPRAEQVFQQVKEPPKTKGGRSGR